jgi:uncharacterized protein YgiM (DUF1202 family)
MKFRFLLSVCIVLLLTASLWSDAGTMSVQVKSGQVRSTPSFLAPVVCAASFGEQVQCLQERDGWTEIRTTGGKKGWIHTSALTAKQVSLSAGSANAKTGASGKELALAGKGFNADVEAQYKASHRDLNYAMVNKMEQIRISPQEMEKFLKAGGVKPAEGGVR